MLKALPTALADAYLLEQFPGATLQAIDAMDFHRLARALEVPVSYTHLDVYKRQVRT